MKIANMVNAWGFPVALHCFGSAIKYAATLQMMASIANSYYLEWNMNECPLKTEIVENPIVVENGMVKISDRPGIGVVLNEKAVDIHAHHPASLQTSRLAEKGVGVPHDCQL